jgi:hypothetical protein
MSELDKIDLHLGSHSANPPYTIPELLGAPLSDRIKAELSQYGFDEFHPRVQVFAPYSQCPAISTQVED